MIAGRGLARLESSYWGFGALGVQGSVIWDLGLGFQWVHDSCRQSWALAE